MNQRGSLHDLQYPYRYPLGKMPASSLFHNRNYYHHSCPDSGAAVGNYGRSIELCTVLLHFVCAVYFDSGLCNSSKKTSELIQLIQHPPEGKCPFIGTILSGGCFFIFLSDLCVEADTLVYFHSPITPTATASHAVVLSRILQVRTIRGWYALHRLFLPSPR